MCAIVGIKFSKDIPKDPLYWKDVKESFSRMFYYASERGNGAAGVYIVNRATNGSSPTLDMLKSPVSSKEFIKTREYKEKIMSKLGPNTSYIIGHTRNATVGSPLDNINNHPHINGNIVGVHNGSIRNDIRLWNINPDMKKKSDCDSEVIFALINKHFNAGKKRGITTEDAIKMAMREIEGWYVVALTNTEEPGRLYLIRDWYSDLVMLSIDDQKIVAFGSSFDYLRQGFSDFGKKNASKMERITPRSNCVIIMNENGGIVTKGLGMTKVGDVMSPEDKKLLAVTNGAASGIN